MDYVELFVFWQNTSCGYFRTENTCGDVFLMSFTKFFRILYLQNTFDAAVSLYSCTSTEYGIYCRGVFKTLSRIYNGASCENSKQLQKQPPEVYCKPEGLKACNFIKKTLQYRYFPMNIVKFLRTSILKKFCERLLLQLLGVTIFTRELRHRCLIGS